MEPLVELPRDRWPELRDLYKQWWPHGVAGHSSVDTNYRKPALSGLTGFRIYCPWGDIKNGAIALNAKGVLNEVIILPTTTEVVKMEEALVSTKLIDWSKPKLFPFCDTDAMRIVNRICARVKINNVEVGPTVRVFRCHTVPQYENIQCPSEAYTGPLTVKHAEEVDKVWPHRYEGSINFFKLLIENELSFGLFSSKDHSLLSWIFFNEVGFLTHLYTYDEHRGKGYGEYLMKYVSNQEASAGRYLWGHIVEGNNKSLNLFRKLEYEIVGRGVWIYVEKKTESPVQSCQH